MAFNFSYPRPKSIQQIIACMVDIDKAFNTLLTVAEGGTNSPTALNNNRVMVSSGGAIVEAGAMTNGQLLIGSTSSAPVVAAITGTANRLTVTNGAGSINLNVDTGLLPSPTGESVIGKVLRATGDNTATWQAITVSNSMFSGQLGLEHGGTAANLTADKGGIVWCDTSALAILAHTTTANQVLLSGNAATPAWSTAVYPTDVVKGDLLYGSATSTIGRIADVAVGSVLASGGIGADPTWSTTPQLSRLGLGAASDATNVLTITKSSSIAIEGINLDITDTGTTGHNTTAGSFAVASSATVTGTNQLLVGVYAGAVKTGTSTSINTISVVGLDSEATNLDDGAFGTRNTFGGVFSATGVAAGTAATTTYGIYVSASGADTNWAAYLVGNANITGALTLGTPLGVTMGGTGTATQFTAGSVVFAGANGIYNQSNAYLFWDNELHRLGVGTASDLNQTLTVGGNTYIEGSLKLDNPLIVLNGGTGTATQFTAGSVVFAGVTNGIYTQDNANFFWDATNHRLGIGTAAPTSPLQVMGIPTGYANNAAARAAGLTTGALYRSGGDPDVLYIVHDAP